MRTVLLVGAAALVLGAGCFADECDRPVCPDDVTDPDPTSAWDVEQEFILPAGDFVEAWVSMAQGRELVLEFDAAPRPVVWDVHSHDGDQVLQHNTGFDQSQSLQFEAPRENDFFVLWENHSDDDLSMSVRIQLANGDRFVKWL